MRDLAYSTDRELMSALRLLLNEWIVRYSVPHDELGDTLDQLLGGYPLCIDRDGDGDVRLSPQGMAWALLTGRCDRYHPASLLESTLLAGSGIDVLHVAPRTDPSP